MTVTRSKHLIKFNRKCFFFSLYKTNYFFRYYILFLTYLNFLSLHMYTTLVLYEYLWVFFFDPFLFFNTQSITYQVFFFKNASARLLQQERSDRVEIQYLLRKFLFLFFFINKHLQNDRNEFVPTFVQPFSFLNIRKICSHFFPLSLRFT